MPLSSFVGSKICVLSKSKRKYEGTLKKVDREEIVLETDKGRSFAVYRDCIESWFPMSSKSILGGQTLLVARCSRENFKCFGREVFAVSKEDCVDKVKCQAFDGKHCAVVAANFLEMPVDAQIKVLTDCRSDRRSKSQKKSCSEVMKHDGED